MRPILMLLPMKWSTFSGPAIFTVRIQCRPLLMAQPHCEQSGTATEDAGFYAAFEVRGIVGGKFGEDAVVGIGWRV